MSDDIYHHKGCERVSATVCDRSQVITFGLELSV